ncbi:MAG: HlyD family secretion protein [Rubripirellula sp.]
MKKIAVLLVLPALLAWSGCSSESPVGTATKKPRPVSTATLAPQLAPSSSLATASAASWKTEQIGFEIAGRIEWVTEPNQDIEGRVLSPDGDVIIEGTPIARIEDERYQLQVDSANAEVARAQQMVEAKRIEIESLLPSQVLAAEAELSLAQTELDRSQSLLRQNAAPQADVDRADANLKAAQSQITQLEATIRASTSELRSLELQIKQAEQALRDSERNLEDCTLYSSFRGQIADVNVVPGSVVGSGAAVATIQMMDPIKVEIEVSAEDSRRLRKRQRFPVLVTNPDGTQSQKEGFLYLIDATADPLMRTYTLTLLVLNKRVGEDAIDLNANVAVTDQNWRLDFSFLPGYEQGVCYAPIDAIRTDDQGTFLWQVDNLTTDQTLPLDRLLKVQKLRVELGDARIPFLGNWIFQEVKFDHSKFDPATNVIAGKLTVAEGDPDQWDGDTVRVDRSNQWMLRPGDLVQVDLSTNDGAAGFYVPMDALARSSDGHALFVIEGEGESTTVRQQPVKVISQADETNTSSLRRVEVMDGSSLDGVRYVTEGAHYLRDGEPVIVISATGATR